MKKSILLLFIIAYLAIIFWACSSPVSIPEVKNQISATPQPDVSREPWQQEWDRIMSGARKEGSVIVFSSAGPELRANLAPTLESKYGIQMTLITARGGEISERLVRERRSGIFLADIYLGGATTSITSLKPAKVFDPIEPQIILPEVLDPKAWYKEGGIPFIDKERYILQTNATPIGILVINLDYTKPEDIKSYRDLLNPRFKGKIVLNDPTVAGAGGKFFGLVGSKIMGFDFMKELANQEPEINRDERLQTEWLARGKVLVLIGPASGIVTEFQKAGIPLRFHTPSEGSYLASGYGTMSLINQATHPNAARLFINWVLTREGSTLLSKSFGFQSARIDVPTDFLDPTNVRNPQMQYIKGDDEEYLLKEPEYRELAKQIFNR